MNARIFGKNFVKVTVLLIELLNNIFLVTETQCGNAGDTLWKFTKFSLMTFCGNFNFFLEINLYKISFSKIASVHINAKSKMVENSYYQFFSGNFCF